MREYLSAKSNKRVTNAESQQNIIVRKRQLHAHIVVYKR